MRATYQRRFPTTRWSLVLHARGDRPAAQRALQELLGQYWTPLYAFARGKGLSREAAEDAVQTLCARLLESEFTDRVDEERGRLRAYLRASMANHLRSEHERTSTQKRGGDRVIVPLEPELLDRVDAGLTDEPGDAFDRRWARAVMGRALDRLEAEFAEQARSGPFEVVRAYFSGQPLPPYAELAETHDTTVPRIKSLLHRARARYRRHLTDEVAHTVGEQGDVDAELAALLEVLAG